MRCLINSPTGFDIFEMADLAEDRGFDGIQLYLNTDLSAEVERLEKWCRTLERKRLSLAVHLPPDLDPVVLSALDRILQPETPVICHYPEQRYLPPESRAAWEFAPFGIRRAEYLRWLEHCHSAGAIPVFDLPRVFKDTDEVEAGRFADSLFTGLAGIPYILHLIDCHSAEQERDQWCELGRGRVGRYLEQAVFPLPEIAVLEFESLIQSVKSLPWLRRVSRSLGL